MRCTDLKLNMGKFNSQTALTNEHTCILCQSGEIVEQGEDRFRATFDYTCAVCNPNVTIVVTDAVWLGKEHFKKIIKEDKYGTGQMRKELSNWTAREYRVHLEKLHQFVGLCSGAVCPISGIWMCDSGGLVTNEIVEGSHMPRVNNEVVRWRLIIPILKES